MPEEFEQMLNESFKTIKTGEVVKGTVLAVKENEVCVNIGYKHDGIIKLEDLTADAAALQPGDEIEAKVVKINDGDGNVILSQKRMRVERESAVLQEALENQTVLTATVDEVVKGGLTATVDDTKVFIPASLVSDHFEKDLSPYAGQEISFIVTEYVPKKHRVIGDRKQLLITERKAALKSVLDNINVGDIVEGTVKNVKDFGAFIDIGGADGLLHISEMSWGRIKNPNRLYKVGDRVRCFVKNIEGEKIGLSVKFPDENPWNNAEVKYAVGNVVTGKVARLTDFGAFVELDNGIDGLLHVSQITRERIEKPADALTEGQEVTVKVTGLDLENKKISLSMKALLPREERPQRGTRNGHRNEDNLTTADGTVNIEAYIKKMDAEEARKEAALKAAEKAEAEKEALEDKAVEVKAEIAEKVEEVKEAVAEKAEAVAEKAEEVKEAVAEKVEDVKEAVADKIEEIKGNFEKKDE